MGFVLGLILLSAAFLPAQAALAAGTAAGTPITNQATASYTVGSTNYTENSNTTTTRVAEILNVAVVWQDAVVGTSGGSDADIGSYVASALSVSVVKSVGIADPFGGTEPVPAAVLTYTITVNVVGTGTAQGLFTTDSIPANTTYNPGTLNLNAGSLTDAADGDAGDVGATTPGVATVDLGNLTNASGIQTITFDVTIN